MDGDRLQSQVNEISALMAERLRVRGGTLETQLRKAGRSLPRPIRREGFYLAQAAVLARNPKLIRMVNEARVEKAYQAVITHLKGIDPVDRLKGRILGILGSISAALIVMFIVVVYVLVQRGYV